MKIQQEYCLRLVIFSHFSEKVCIQATMSCPKIRPLALYKRADSIRTTNTRPLEKPTAEIQESHWEALAEIRERDRESTAAILESFVGEAAI